MVLRLVIGHLGHEKSGLGDIHEHHRPPELSMAGDQSPALITIGPNMQKSHM